MANGTIAASQLEMLSLSGAGIITITPPATNTNRAITLPDAAGALVVSGTTPSLNGITFPATQVPSADANTLDDYEEGTWTPVVGGTATYTAQVGTYTKVGRLMTVRFRLVINSIGTGTNNQIQGLPIAASGGVYPGNFGYWGSLAISVNYLAFYVNTDSTTMQLVATTASGATITVPFAGLGNSTEIVGSAQYYTA